MMDSFRILFFGESTSDFQLLQALLDRRQLTATARWMLDRAPDLVTFQNFYHQEEYDLYLISDYFFADGNSPVPDKRPLAVPPSSRIVPPSIILLTDRGSAALDEQAFDRGIVDYLDPANLTMDTLERCVRFVRDRARFARERQQVERELRLSKDRFRLMADAAPVLIWISDTTSNCTFFNRRWYEFTGRSPSEEEGDGWAEGIFIDDMDATLRHYQTAFEGQEPFTMEYRLRRADGEYRWIFDTGIPYADDGDTFQGFIGSCVDITDRKVAEAERLAAQQQVAHALQDRQATLLENEKLLQVAISTAEQQRRFFRDVLSSVTEGRLTLCDTEDELPHPLSTRFGDSHTFGESRSSDPPSVRLISPTIRLLRRDVESACNICGLAQERQYDLILAVGEAAMNAVVHAGGGYSVVYYDIRARKIQVWITDEGQGIDLNNLPRATLQTGFSTAGTLGHGFSIILRTCDRVYLRTGPGGTTVVLEQASEPQEPEWWPSD